MDLQKNGSFIAEMRKKQNLTQKQLAEQIGVSDKTISKWECGNSFPDVDIMLPLCQCLKISVNELISGESIAPEEYLGKAEQNMVELVKENETEKRKGTQGLAAMVTLCLSILIVVLLFFMMLGFQISNIMYYIDIPSIIMVIGITFIVLVCAGQIKYLGAGISYLYGKKRQSTLSDEERNHITAAFGLAGNTMLLGGVLVTLFGFIIVLQNMNLNYLGPSLAVALLTIVYGLLGKIIFTILMHSLPF